MMVQMYGALFLMAGPMPWRRTPTCVATCVYRLLPVRWQARLDFRALPDLLLPGHAGPVLVRLGDRVGFSWRYQEVSWNSPARIQIYFFKTLIPLAGGLLLLQGLRRIAALLECDENW